MAVSWVLDHHSRWLRSRRRFLSLAGAGALGLTLTGCGWRLGKVQTNDVAQAASDELYIYTWDGYFDKELLESFREKTGIKVTAQVFGSNEEMLANFQAGKGAVYSLVYPSITYVAKMSRLGLLAELDHAKLEGLNNLYPRFRQSQYDPNNRHSVPFTWGTTGIIYNKEKLNIAPTDWSYLWQHRDKLVRRMTLLADPREVLGAVLQSLGYSSNTTDPKQIKQAYVKLVDLKPAIATFTTDAWQDQIVAGDLLLAMVYSSDAFRVMQENPKLQYVIPSSGTSLWSDTMAIPKTAPNPEGAYAWINFLLQPEVAAQLTERLQLATPNQQATQLLPPQIRQSQVLFPADTLLTKAETVAPSEDRSINELYDKYWTKLTSS
jgi:spermidine/putrescine transport system substrate-binding protein